MQKNVLLARLLYWEASFASALEGPYREIYGASRFVNYLPDTLVEGLFSSFANGNAFTERLRKKRIEEASSRKMTKISALGSLTKFAASDLAMENCRLALEIMGESGWRHEQGVDKILRDAQLLQIYEGTNELNRISALKDLCAEYRPDTKFFE
jgi:alkylation response protein AidB-like acyl-CoA dehydrogenase